MIKISRWLIIIILLFLPNFWWLTSKKLVILEKFNFWQTTSSINKREANQIEELKFWEQATAFHEAAHWLINSLEKERLTKLKINSELIRSIEIKVHNRLSKEKKLLTNDDGSIERGGYHLIFRNKNEKAFTSWFSKLSSQQQLEIRKTSLKRLLAGYLSEKLFLSEYTLQQTDLKSIRNDMINFDDHHYCKSITEKTVAEQKEWCRLRNWWYNLRPFSDIIDHPIIKQLIKEVEAQLKTHQKKLFTLAEIVWNVKFLQEAAMKKIILAVKNNQSLPEKIATIVNLNREEKWYLLTKNHYFPQTERKWQNLEQQLTNSQTKKQLEKNPKIATLLQVIKAERTRKINATSKEELERSSYDSFIKKVVADNQPEINQAWNQLVTWNNDQFLDQEIDKTNKKLKFWEQTTALHEAAHWLINSLEGERLTKLEINSQLMRSIEIKVHNKLSKEKKLVTNDDGSIKRTGYHLRFKDKNKKEFDNWFAELTLQKQLEIKKASLKTTLAGYLSEKMFLKETSTLQSDLTGLLFYSLVIDLEELGCQLKVLPEKIWCNDGENKKFHDPFPNHPIIKQLTKEVEAQLKTHQKKLFTLAEIVWNVKFLQEAAMKKIILAVKNNQSLPEKIATIVNLNREENWYLPTENHYFPQTERKWQNLEQQLTNPQTSKQLEKNPEIATLLQVIKAERVRKTNATSKEELERSSYDSFIRKVVAGNQPEINQAWKQLVALTENQPIKPITKSKEKTKQTTSNSNSTTKLVIIIATSLLFISLIIGLGWWSRKKLKKKKKQWNKNGYLKKN